MRTIEYLILHTTAGNQNNSARQINEWFLAPEKWITRDGEKINIGGLGWSVGGYHIIIEKDGKAVRMYGDHQVTNGIKSFWTGKGLINNSNSLHISYVGGLRFENGKVAGNEDTRTAAQIQTQKELIAAYTLLYPNIKILGHNQIARKACPCFWVPQFLLEIGIKARNIYHHDHFNVVKTQVPS